MTRMITTPGDYRTADGGKETITRIYRRGKRARDDEDTDLWWNTKTGKHSAYPAANIVGPWVAEPAQKPLELWANDGGECHAEGYYREDIARINAAHDRTRVAVHMIEASELARVQAERDEAVALLRYAVEVDGVIAASARAFLAKIGGSK